MHSAESHVYLNGTLLPQPQQYMIYLPAEQHRIILQGQQQQEAFSLEDPHKYRYQQHHRNAQISNSILTPFMQQVIYLMVGIFYNEYTCYNLNKI
jgi:hypothetical protein